MTIRLDVVVLVVLCTIGTLLGDSEIPNPPSLQTIATENHG